MKKILIYIILIFPIILLSCSNKKVASLELRNKQLKHSVDSLVVLNNKLQIIAEKQRVMADSAAAIASKSMMEAIRQKQIAVKLYDQNKTK